VKLPEGAEVKQTGGTFSILERIDVGETGTGTPGLVNAACPFSILERIDVGETRIFERAHEWGAQTFSILERIDVGETCIA